MEITSPTKISGKHHAIFEAYYKQIDPKNTGCIEAKVAATFLKKSGLSDVVLSRIWDLSEPNGKGHLDKDGFFIAIKLVAIAQCGHDINIRNINMDMDKPPKIGEIPKIMPPKIQTVQPNMADWSISADDQKKYDQLFFSLQPIDGMLPGNKVKCVLMDSKLPFDILSKIWDLADQDRDGNLNKPEFLIAMHLVYQALNKKAIPATLPDELQKQLITPNQTLILATNIEETSFIAEFPDEIPPPEPTQFTWNQTITPKTIDWVVPYTDKARFEAMFIKSDSDNDGLVSGIEIKDVFLQSGIPNICLAQIWALCDSNQIGKLTSEQFALAMWMVEQKQKGIDPPEVLSANMIPPSQRVTTTSTGSGSNINQRSEISHLIQPTREMYSNPELEIIATEIEKITSEKQKLEHEITQKEADIRIKSGEVKSLQSELDTLTATLKQLEAQKIEAEKRLNELKVQVTKVRIQCQKQEEIIKEKEGEVNSRRDELQKLKDQEQSLEKEYQKNQKECEHFAKQLQTIQLQISQIKFMVSHLQEIQRQMTSSLSMCKSAIETNEVTLVTEYALSIQPDFRDTKAEFEKKTKVEDPFNDRVSQSDVSSPFKDEPKIKNDGFGDAFTAIANDAFASSFPTDDPFEDGVNQQPSQIATEVKDEFGCDPFAILHAPTADSINSNNKKSGAPPPRPESPSPALPPKKAKQPPPRPAPPRPMQTPMADNSHNNIDTQNTSTFADFTNFESKIHQITDFSDDPFKDYRYEDPFDIEDPFEKDYKN